MPAPTLAAALAPPFGFVRVLATLSWRCAGCAAEHTATVPVLVDWFDRIAAQEQRRAADGLSCPDCGSLAPLPVPLLQWRRADAVGLLVGLPGREAIAGAEAHIRDTLIAAQSTGHALDGARSVLSVPLRWWARLWNAPLGPRLLGAIPMALPAAAEEVEHWRTQALSLLALPPIGPATAKVLTAATRDEAIAAAEQYPELLDPRWRVTVAALVAAEAAAQPEDNVAQAVRDRGVLLRQLQTFGADGLRAILTDDREHPTDPVNPMRVALANAGVEEFRGQPDADPGAVRRSAEAAVTLATTILGPDHELTLAARLNHAVAVEEDGGDDPEVARATSAALLAAIAPAAAASGTRAVVDVMVNMATLAARAPGTYADNPHHAAELLEDARHVGGLLSDDDRRTRITRLVDEAAVMRSRATGSPRENAACAVELLDEAIALDDAWQIASAAERTLIVSNRSNAVTQLFQRGGAAADAARDAARAAIDAAATVPGHPVAIEALSNAGASLTDVFLADRGRTELAAEARQVLERAVEAAADAFPAHHPVLLRAQIHLAGAHGTAPDGDRQIAARLLRDVIEHAQDERFRATAAANLAQLRSGDGNWAQAGEAYEAAAAASDELLVAARTPMGRFGVIADFADLAARRAVVLVMKRRPADALAVLERNRGRLAGRTGDVLLPQPPEGHAVLHAVTSDHGSACIVTLPGGGGTAFVHGLGAATLKPLLAAVLAADDPDDRRSRLDALLAPLRDAIVDRVSTILDEQPITDLGIVACGALASCPLHAIADAHGQSWADRYVVRYRLSAQVAPAIPPSLERVVAVIDPDGSLPFAATERDVLARHAVVLEEPPDGADRSRWLMRHLPGASVAHLACHAALDPEDPMRSAFRLGASETLTVADLTTIATERLTLVVAPACQSASASPAVPDELLGVGHALAHAGARNVIASLWDADDAATALVVARFYTELAVRPDAAHALTLAQRYVAAITGPQLRALTRARLDADPEALWLPYDLAIELNALTLHPAMSPPGPCFGHPADWAALSCLEA